MMRNLTMLTAACGLICAGCAAGGAGEAAGAESVAAGGAASVSVLGAVLKQFGPPVMLVARAASPPVIDGKLDDAAWRKADPVSLGFLTGRWERPTQKTEARAGRREGDLFRREVL